MEVILRVAQKDAPCVLHKNHAPNTVFNEKHHVLPQEWQNDLWGKVRDNRTISICATGHNTIHGAIKEFKKTGKWPSYCTGQTRYWAEQAIIRYNDAKAALDNTPPTV